eukprot:3240195-Rhodomonas_salina.1
MPLCSYHHTVSLRYAPTLLRADVATTIAVSLRYGPMHKTRSSLPDSVADDLAEQLTNRRDHVGRRVPEGGCPFRC